MDLNSRIDTLRTCTLELDDHSAALLAEVAMERRFGPGEYTMFQGSPGDSLGVVVTGGFDVVASAADGREIVFRRLTPGDLVGELTVVDGSARLASIRAVGDTSALVIGRPAFLDVAHRAPGLALALARVCAQKTRHLSSWAEAASFADGPSRLAGLLLDLCHESGDNVGDRSRVAITQQDLATRLGITRESVNKQLKSLQRSGLIESRRGVVDIPSRLALGASVA